jgi:hypothetical protein
LTGHAVRKSYRSTRVVCGEPYRVVLGSCTGGLAGWGCGAEAAKKTPFPWRPITAAWLCDDDAGSTANRKPSCRNLAIGLLRSAGATNIAAALRTYGARPADAAVLVITTGRV